MMAAPAYDALVLVSFGGPERPEDVMPFLEVVTRGRGVPRARLASVAEHYHRLGGRSPLNDQNRALIAALGADLAAHGIDLPIFFGNRNWHPLLADTVAEMKRAGVRRALAFVTSAYSSYSGCRQYLEDIARARAAVAAAPVIEPLRRFFNHPDFVAAVSDRVRTAWTRLRAGLPGPAGDAARLVFTAHSVPRAMADGCTYERELRTTAALVAERLGHGHWDLVWQSRSGPAEVPWLEPDVLDHVRALGAQGVPGIVLAPIGFLSDHVEVLYDLDVEARGLCAALGLPMVRAATVGTHPRFVACIRELVRERLEGAPALSVGPLPPSPDVCAPDCCPAPGRSTTGTDQPAAKEELR
ncbi:MAG: ferrochelatase [Polyangiaceae bacterium UTPRO1]|jgi:ferrochelatase|nr:MAG: ferrochelatase [Polyangiaceae bacterium UTPRO1]